MNTTGTNQDLLRLRSPRAAKVSEISEAVAASSLADEEKVNFHIGNPIQEPKLTWLFLRTILDLPTHSLDGSERIDDLASQLDLGMPFDEALEFFYHTLKKSAAYAPRGGFSSKSPNGIIQAFHHYLTQAQSEALDYDIGADSGRRECSIGCGGIWEGLRVFFTSISSHILAPSAHFILDGIELPNHLKHFPKLTIECLDSNTSLISSAISFFDEHQETPLYILLGRIPDEDQRRRLRKIAITRPLMIVELNEAPNALSMAREALMRKQVLRFLTPAVLSRPFKESSVFFLCGSAAYIRVFDIVHFEIKGTPSVPEIELLQFLGSKTHRQKTTQECLPDVAHLSENEHAMGSKSNLGRRVDHANDRRLALIESKIFKFDKHFDLFTQKAKNAISSVQRLDRLPSGDHFNRLPIYEFWHHFLTKIDDREWVNELQDGFKMAFAGHHREYDPESCLVVSGSARTALSLLGYHCGIREVIVPDFSWTYEHCFPKCQAVPLTPTLDLDIERIKIVVEERLKSDPKWVEYGAVCLNNPHNASGKIFDARTLQALCLWLLSRGIRIIDDLAYQHLAPTREFPIIATLQQMVGDLTDAGKLTKRQAQNLITIHSLSKTDCFAGARLAIAHIPDQDLRKTFRSQIGYVKPNVTAVFFATLFYRRSPAQVHRFWAYRNTFFRKRMVALDRAFSELPKERNPYGITLHWPQGAMYPHMEIRALPPGISLDWLATGLAKQGIGLVPLSTFTRTAQGFELARRSFRLTLGGTDGGSLLARKMRRVLIDLNRKIADETSRYVLKELPTIKLSVPNSDSQASWFRFRTETEIQCAKIARKKLTSFSTQKTEDGIRQQFFDEYLPERMADFGDRFSNTIQLNEALILKAKTDRPRVLLDFLEKELYKQSLSERQNLFQKRLFDRTVHPTQAYSLGLEKRFWNVVPSLTGITGLTRRQKNGFADALWEDFLCRTVSIDSIAEADELTTDLSCLIQSEDFQRLSNVGDCHTFLSFWGDWDGSTRPSGQGHRLIAGVLLQNISNTIDFLAALRTADPGVEIDSALLDQITTFPIQRQRFWQLLNSITTLTYQLEKRFRSVLPVHTPPNHLRDFFARFGLVRTSLKSMWEHNDRLEKRMQDLRKNRRSRLEYFFQLNKRLRKTLHANLATLRKNLHDPQVLSKAAMYRNLMNRVVLTPRIHQKTITSKDPFSIETTAQNVVEINEISGRFGHPGMVLALQVSMSTQAEALISLDRLLRACAEKAQRESSDIAIAPIWTVPLFEDMDTVKNVEGYLDEIWQYCVHSRRLQDSVENRFSEMICELFIAGSDLSQQIGQTAAARFYRQAKFKIFVWLAQRGLTDRVRLKLGCGEPMQRQGGNFAPQSGQPSFASHPEALKNLKKTLRASTVKSTQYARSPLAGVLSSGDLRTYQSNFFERFRGLDIATRSKLLFQVRSSQAFHDSELSRASEVLRDTRLQFETRGVQELKSLTIGSEDERFSRFVELATDNFRQILYGREEDVVGVHAISYFISQSIPTLRDRPTVRPSRHAAENPGQRILEKIADTIPFSKHGTLLRAIGHNRAQTMILGLNQLTTGLFRGMSLFAQEERPGGDPVAPAKKILPNLPVYEILHTMRLFHDPELRRINTLVKAYPPGNSAFPAIREDMDAFFTFQGTLQQELLRRQGVHVAEFFDGNEFRRDLLSSLRPDLAVLMQANLFNTDIEKMLPNGRDGISDAWLRETDRLLDIRNQVLSWRSQLWDLLEKPVFDQVKSFVALSKALYSLAHQNDSQGKSNWPIPHARIKPDTLELLKSSGNEPLKQFLGAATQYLHQLHQGRSEVPLEIVRALKDVERILIIERKAVAKHDLERLNFFVLQMARVCGENG